GADRNGDPMQSAELYDPVSATWMATGSLGHRRSEHTATLLPNGKVLVAGGFDSGFPTMSAELYDPATGTWTATGSLTAARADHTATLLPNGKVLVAGGYGLLSSAELYDPASGTWTATGSLATARADQTARLLPNGKVLAAGGHTMSAELYDPASGTWASTASLATGRLLHTATLLPNGKVLVAGGEDTSLHILASAELYNVGLGFATASQPKIKAIKSHGNQLQITGKRFQGISQASGGNTQDSATNYPLAQLRSIDSAQVTFLPVDSSRGWSNTSFTSGTITSFPAGPAVLTVFANGIPSQMKYLTVTQP
ncbi:MAG TPA: kelch repeat-containing protein, partial [Candidatus Binataceae bacterium]|nr:kelch repeat-containing protein [Candidatus Binataceae bacterium]